MNGKKRWLLSVIGGFALPFGYALIIGQLNAAHSDDTFSLLLRLPFTWPTYICDFFYTLAFDPTDELHGFRGVEVYVLAIIVGNVIAYTLLTYAFLSWWMKARKIKHSAAQI